jgi:hypothetical protein
MKTPEDTAISQLRTYNGWWNGDVRAREILAEYRAAVIKAEREEAERVRVELLEIQAREERE